MAKEIRSRSSKLLIANYLKTDLHFDLLCPTETWLQQDHISLSELIDTCYPIILYYIILHYITLHYITLHYIIPPLKTWC